MIIVALGVAVALGSMLFSRGDGGGVVQPQGDCSSCSGDSAKCAHECMMEAAVNPVEYYDDEELDAFAGRRSDDYTDDEAEQFREVMLTMNPREVAPWSRSLTLRGINPPDQIKDEMVMMIEDAGASEA